MSEDRRKMHRFVANPPNAAARQVVEKLKAEKESKTKATSPYRQIAPDLEAYQETPPIDNNKLSSRR